MFGVPGGLLVHPTLATAPPLAPFQVAGPSAVVDASSPVRALAAFVCVAVLGGVLLWRNEAFVDRSIDASMARPLSSLGYGVAAHAVIAFGGSYLATQLAGMEVLGRNAGAFGVLAGLLLALLAGSLGFTVVGSAIVGLGGQRRPWHGLVVGALIAGVAGLLDVLAGGLLWFVVVSMGIGGPARRWLHADAVPER